MPTTQSPTPSGDLQTPFAFASYGLSLHTNVRIPGLLDQTAGPSPDVRIWMGEAHPEQSALLNTQEEWVVSPILDASGRRGRTISKLAGGSYFRLVYFDGTEFVIDATGCRVWATWPANGNMTDAASYLLGPVLGFVLRLRGVTSLHASAISIEGQAIAFVGPHGAGKSTTAAAFGGRGYPVVSDDIVALTTSGETFMVQPGYPRLRLWPSSVDALTQTGIPLPHSLSAKWGSSRRYYLDLTRDGYEFERQPLPLVAIYLLTERTDDASAPYVRAMTGSEGLMALVTNAYAATLLDNARRAQEFQLFNRLLNRLPLRQVFPHTDADHLAKLCDVILEDFRELQTQVPRRAK